MRSLMVCLGVMVDHMRRPSNRDVGNCHMFVWSRRHAWMPLNVMPIGERAVAMDERLARLKAAKATEAGR